MPYGGGGEKQVKIAGSVGRAALTWTAEREEGVAKMLLKGEGVRSNPTETESGGMPLCWMTKCGVKG